MDSDSRKRDWECWFKLWRAMKDLEMGRGRIKKPLTVWITINWKILKEMGISDHLTCLLRNLFVGKEATVRTGHGTTDYFKIGKGVHQGCILSLCLFNFHAEYIMQNARLDEDQAGIKVAGRNINNHIYADNTTLYGRKQRGSKEPLDKGKRGEWKKLA